MDREIGPTDELRLRVSVAALARVLFTHPSDKATMLALEHKAYIPVETADRQISVQAQPFGGAVRISDPEELERRLGAFRFDSQRSHDDRDFRIFVRDSSWDRVLELCRKEWARGEGGVVESDPIREMEEEFKDALGIELDPDQYSMVGVGVILEDQPRPTINARALGEPTARIYKLHEVWIQDLGVVESVMTHSESHGSKALRSEVLEAARSGGPARANGILVAPLEAIRAAYLDVPPERRARPLPFNGTLLGGNVPAVLEDVFVPDYQFQDQR